MKDALTAAINGQTRPAMTRIDRIIDRAINGSEALRSEYVVLGHARFVQIYGTAAARRFNS